MGNDLETLMKVCVANNHRQGITGMLLYGKECFMQVLEGEADEVDQLIAHIKKDSRHTNVDVIVRTPIKSRDFGMWSMGYRVVNENAKHYPAFVDFFSKVGESKPADTDSLALQVLKLFAFPEEDTH